MTLSALIRKRDTGNLATAIPAIPATQPKGEAATVARIATVAVANPKGEKTAPPAKVGAGDTATTSRWWLIRFGLATAVAEEGAAFLQLIRSRRAAQDEAEGAADAVVG